MSTANRGVNIGPPRFKIAVHSIVWLAKSGGVLSSVMIVMERVEFFGS
jgi:Rrf2 family transcriptional repressor of oqxAB